MVYKHYVYSTNLEYVEYDEDHVVMRVQFKNGSIYEYSGVPKKIFNQIVQGALKNKEGEKSVGATFIKLVKNNPQYKYRKLTQ